jgi:hypothetical protein
MSRKSLVVLVALLLLSAGALTAQVRTTKPNDVTISLGGQCLIWSFDYQRCISPDFALNASVSYIGATDEEGTAGVFFLTGGARYFMLKKPASPYLSAGIAWISAGTDAGPFGSDSASTVYFYASPGFEFRSEGGFVFRGGVYFLIKHGFFVWPGISLGIAF